MSISLSRVRTKLILVAFLALGTLCTPIPKTFADESAQNLIESGQVKVEQGLYDEAIADFEKVKEIGDKKEISKAQRKIDIAIKMKNKEIFNKGKLAYQDGDFDTATLYFEEVLAIDPSHSGAKRYLSRTNKKSQSIQKEDETPSSPISDGILRRMRRMSQAERFEAARQAFHAGRIEYYAGNYEVARMHFEEALTLNPFYVPASRYIEAIVAYEQSVATAKSLISSDDSMVEVTEAWLPPEKKRIVKEEEVIEADTDISEAKLRLMEQSEQIIPAINFNNAQLSDVIKYLSGISGINIVIDESVFESVSAVNEEPEIQSVATEGDEVKSASPAPKKTQTYGPRSTRVSISLKNIPLIEALKYILRAKGLKFIIEDYAILIVGSSYVPPEDLETRYYHLASGVGTFTTFDMGSGGMGDDDEDEDAESETITIKDILEESGVPWPKGSKIFLDIRTGTLIARNTPTNLAIVEDILRTLDVTPFQVSIQARFVELSQTEAEDLGLEWILNDDWKLLQHEGAASGLMPVGAKSRIQIDKIKDSSGAAAGLTRNLRWFTTDESGGNTVLPNGQGSPNPILSISGILTNPEFSVILHALAQDGNKNVLSAPRVTTINGQRAQIEVVEEYIYPTEFEITPATTNSEGSVITPPVVAPGAFETRDIGIILDVTPNVGGDKKTINLTIIPEVSELVTWLNYGVTSTLGSYPIYQPLFSTRNVTTSVIINDGETVVLGGMIREEQTLQNDKIPFLGDLPIIGYAFKKKAEYKVKRNLLIFVSAELITPTGERLIEVE
ncbi:MAG: hypothetical protein P9M03_00885 [Candidatus Theseobacter exili]|nr:hypothetical protein [Candidatus Theseobacter exili]